MVRKVMGFFSGLRGAGGYIFNFRVTRWLGLDSLKDNTKGVANTAKAVFTPEEAEQSESFEEALKRLNITEQELESRRQEFTKLLIIYVILGIVIFGYSLYIAISFGNLLGFFMGLALTVFALSYAFRYHFWIYQIKHKKLGSTFRDWFLDKN